MLSDDLFCGKLVRLAAIDPEPAAQAFSRWNRDSLYGRLSSDGPPFIHTPQAIQEWIVKEGFCDPPKMHWFAIHTIEDDRLIGDVNLSAVFDSHAETVVGIGIGERDFWGRGLGTEAMRLVLRYAFIELDMHRVALNTFEYNARAIRSYEKLGFRHEGRERCLLHRDGRRWDLLWMGLLRSEWEAQQTD